MMSRRLALFVYAAFSGVVCGATALIELGGGWMGELLANLRLQLAIAGGMLAVGGLLLALRWWRRLMLAMLSVALAGLHVLPLLPYIASPPPPGLQAANGGPLRLLVANVHSWAVDRSALEKLLREGGADIAVLTEISFDQQAVYRAVLPLYPEQFETPVGRDNTYTVRILARRRMDVTVHHPVAFDHPVLQARFCALAQRCLTILSAHTPRPGPVGRPLRNRVLQDMAARASLAVRQGDQVIVAGDFNLSAFSPDFAVFAAAGLIDTALGRGYPSTWPFGLPGLGLGLDHVLVSPGIGVVKSWLGPDINSDHYPLFVELILPGWR